MTANFRLLTPHAALLAAIAATQAAISHRKAIDAALSANTQQRAEAKRSVAELEAMLPGFDARIGIASAKAQSGSEKEKAELVKLQKEANKASDNLVDRKSDLHRAEAATSVLYSEAENADAAVAREREMLLREVTSYRDAILVEFAASFRVAAQPIAALIPDAAALDAALPGGFIRRELSLMTLVDPETAKIIYDGYGDKLKGDSLLARDQVSESAQEMTAALQDLINISAGLKEYRTFQRSSYAAARDVAKTSRQDQPVGDSQAGTEFEWTPPKSTFKPSSTVPAGSAHLLR